jgi:hypothetical protein
VKSYGLRHRRRASQESRRVQSCPPLTHFPGTWSQTHRAKFQVLHFNTDSVKGTQWRQGTTQQDTKSGSLSTKLTSLNSKCNTLSTRRWSSLSCIGDISTQNATNPGEISTDISKVEISPMCVIAVSPFHTLQGYQDNITTQKTLKEILSVHALLSITLSLTHTILIFLAFVFYKSE